MRTSVRDAWPSFVSKFEGRIPTMYLDTLRFVTFKKTSKIEDNGVISDYGLTRPWRDDRGNLVLESVIRTEWAMINSHTELAPKGGAAFATVATLHLPDVDIDEALMETTGQFWLALVRTLPALESWPGDAQLALLDMAYHMGPAFLGPKWPKFTAAARIGDFGACAADCQTVNRSPRDQAHVKLFLNAAGVHYAGLDPATLWGITRTPMVEAWPTPGAARTAISSAKVAAAKANVFNIDAWYVQRMLQLAGRYTSKVDGLFGPVSKAAYVAWAKSTKRPGTVSATVLGALSAATLRMAVT